MLNVLLTILSKSVVNSCELYCLYFRHKYYDFLQVANEGDVRPFIRFVADCTDKTLDLFLWATSELSHQIPLLSDPDENGSTTLYDHILDNDNEDSSGDNTPA